MVHPAYVYEASLSPQEQVPITSVPAHPTTRSHADSVELDFERVYADNFDFIWRAARSLGIPAESAEDVTHDIFLVVHRKLSSLQDPSALRSWLFGIARRVCKDYRRALGRRGTQLELDAQREIDHRQDPQNAALSRQALQVVERYAEGLDEERRALFFLALLEGLPVAEVASTLELNANTTYSRVRVMRRELAELLGAEASDTKGNDESA